MLQDLAVGRTPCGCVDRNPTLAELKEDPSVAPLAGAWIEILHTPRYAKGRLVAPLAGAWIEILH